MAFDLNDPETKAAVAELVAEATAALASKNKELLGEVKKARKDSAIDPEAHAALELKVDELEGKLSQSEKLVKQSATEADKFKKLHEAESGFTSKMLVESGIRAELSKAGVTDSDFADALLSNFSRSAKVEADGENRVIKIGDKLASDAITDWKATPAAAKFITAAHNNGGGANGGKSTPAAGKTMTRSQFDSTDQADKVSFMASGGQLTD